MSKSVKDLLKHYGETTSVKGISKILKSPSFCLKCLWSIAFVVGILLGGYQVVIMILSFSDNNIVTKVKICDSCHPPFPDVTVCNPNPIGLVADLEVLHPNIIQFHQYIDIMNQINQNTDYYYWHFIKGLTFEEIFTMYTIFIDRSGYFQHINVTEMFRYLADAAVNYVYKGLVHSCTW